MDRTLEVVEREFASALAAGNTELQKYLLLEKKALEGTISIRGLCMGNFFLAELAAHPQGVPKMQLRADSSFRSGKMVLVALAGWLCHTAGNLH